MIDRIVHHAEIISLKGESYRLKNHDLDRAGPRARTPAQPDQPLTQGGEFS